MEHMATDYDVCIIGSGAGAGPVAYTLAKQGYKVLILEKGPWLNEKDFYKDEIAISRRNTYTPNLNDEPQVIEDINSDGKWIAASNAESEWDFWNGSMVGGSSNLMSGFFHRLKPVDFRLLDEFGPVADANVANWPIAYDDLEPYYALTEKAVGISGKVVDHKFLEPRSTPDFPFPPTVEHLFAEKIDTSANAIGYKPLPMARAILPQSYNNRMACSYSGYCGSYGCTTGAKGSSRAALLNPAIKTGNCEIRPNSHVYHIDTDRKGNVIGVRYFDKYGYKVKVNAKIYVVAAQAIETSRLLLLSKGPKHPNGLGNNYNQVGKNLIFSAGGIGSGDFFADQFNSQEFTRLRDIHPFVNRALQDWYVIDDPSFGPRMKGGTIDFLLAHANPIRRATNLKWENNTLVWGKELKKKIYNDFTKRVQLNFEIFCDWMPNNNCYVTLSNTVKDKWGLPVANIRVGYHEHDLVPGNYLAKKAGKLMTQMGGKNVSTSINGSPSSNLQAGGCRFGTNPETSVLDPNCKVHDVDNLFVTDASFMPTGGSVTPTWTIYANAFRVADVIAKQL